MSISQLVNSSISQINTSVHWPFHANDNIELESFTDAAIDERTESEVSESKFKTEVEEKVQNNKVELESFTNVDIDERTKSELTKSKFKTEEENSLLMNWSTDN